MKKFYFIFLILFSIFVFASPCFAENFYINDYNVSLDVHRDRSVHVVEEIDLYFFRKSHGIIREIITKGDTVSNIHVSEDYVDSCNFSLCSIKIGNPNELISGEKKYKITYDYQIKSNKNEFYYNIIGTKWGVPIKKARFDINMPSSVEFKDVGISIGTYGQKGFVNRATYKVYGTKITGETNEKLAPYEGITIHINVPRGYFLKNTNILLTILTSLLLFLTLSSFLIWYFWGKDDLVTPVVSFYPPKNMNPIEAQIVYRGKAETTGLSALIVYLASKGYIKIASSRDGFKLTKIKDYDGTNAGELKFMKTLFKDGNTVRENELKFSKTFYIKCREIIDTCNKKISEVYDKDSVSFKLKALSILCLLGVLAITLFVSADYQTGLFVMLPFFAFPIIGIFTVIKACTTAKSIGQRICEICGGLVFAIIPASVFAPVLSGFFTNREFLFLGIICAIVCIICYYQLPKRNKKGNRLQGELLGLKHFIEVAEKSRIIMFAKKQPSYFYDIMPYAYILGVSDVWIKQFEEIMKEVPECAHYSSYMHSFNHFADSFGACSAPSHENGGISSSSSGGGGCSGGGHGGGGGCSW